MSTQPDSSSDNLDRTDELPQLDVVAYEASLAENQKGLSRTDTWTVEALQDIDQLAESAQQNTPAPVRNAGKESSRAEALTVNVERILKRIAELEAEIIAAHDANTALQKRSEAIQADRDQQALRIRALEAENARLGEHRALSEEMVQRAERQLREQSRHADARLKELQSTQLAERARSDRERDELQRQITQIATRDTALQDDNRVLQDRLHTSIAVANQRSESLAALEKSLSDEKTSTAQLARQLAAKLRDCEMLASVVNLRNRTMDDLTRARDDLDQRLQRETASGLELAAQLAMAEQRLRENHATLLEREDALAEKDKQLAQLTADLDRTAGEHELAWQQRDAATQKLSALDAAHSESLSELAQRLVQIDTLRSSLETAELRQTTVQHELAAAVLASANEERQRLELEARLQEAQQSIAVLGNECDAAQAQIRSLSEQRDALAPASAELATRTAELEQSSMELTQLRSELAAARAAVHSHEQLLNERTDELSGLRTKSGEHGTAIRALEHAIRTRDELVEGLMAQLQIVRDERAMLAAQLDKAGKRVKSLTQHIFSRDNQIAELRTDLAVHTEALAAIRRDVNRIGESADAKPSDEVERMLEPIEHTGAPIFLTGKTFTVGRTNENDISIPSKLVSRHHARLLVGPTGVIIEDAGSTNGCFVNGEQVKQHLMHDGDVLELGDLRYRLRTRSTHDTRIRTNVVPILDSRRSDD